MYSIKDIVFSGAAKVGHGLLFCLRNKKCRTIIVCAVLIIFSATLLFNAFSSDTWIDSMTQKLDENRSEVARVSLEAGLASFAIAAIPDDSTTPIADQVASVSSYLAIVVGMITLEKLLLISSGFIFCRLFIPFGLTLLAFAVAFNRDILRTWAIRILCFAICALLLVPFSLWIDDNVSDMIDKLGESDVLPDEVEITEEEIEADKPSPGVFEAIGGWFSNLFSNVSNAADNALQVLNDYIDRTILRIIKDVVIPVVTFIVMVWLINNTAISIFGTEKVAKGKRIVYKLSHKPPYSINAKKDPSWEASHYKP